MYNSALVAKMLQSERQIPKKSVTKPSMELEPSLGKYEPISEITETKPTSDYPHFLSTESGIS